MVFNSLAFLGFLIPILILYYVLPGDLRSRWVLMASLAFYAFYNWKVVPLLVFYALAVHFFAVGIEKRTGAPSAERSARWFFAAGVILLLIPLLICKYTAFAFSIFGAEMKRSLVLPLGISYFTFKSISYLIDVRRAKVKAERDPVVTMAFVTFFPEILTGPIDRASNLMTQLKEKRPDLTGDDARRAVLYFLAGCAQKMILADRIGLYVDAVYGDLTASAGLPVIAAACGYSLQIYFDFAGCTLMALGVGKLLGFSLPENFRRPYLGVSVTDFWRRWHISLTSWLRDYIYIPLGGNRKGAARKYLNILIVFFVSGLWHGAGWTFIVWGLINGILQVIEGLTGSILKRTAAKTASHAENPTIGVNTQSEPVIGQPAVPVTQTEPVKWLKRAVVFILMTCVWVFFRAESLTKAGQIFSSMGLARAGEAFAPLIVEAGLKNADLALIVVMLVICLVLALRRERGADLCGWIIERPFAVRAAVFYMMIFAVILFGIYGTAYNAASFIYLQF